LSRRELFDSSQRLVQELVDDGFTFNTIYDIGAFRGEFTSSMRKILPKSEYFLFEGNEIHALELSKLNVSYFIEVLSDANKNQQWWSILGTGDSLFRENQDVYKTISSITKNTKTLDSIIDEHNLALPDLIKIDVQGAELLVLSGGKQAVANAALIFLEIPILEYNKGAPRIDEYLEYMKKVDFIPIEVLEVHKADGIIIQIDMAFVRKDFWLKKYNLAGRDFLN